MRKENELAQPGVTPLGARPYLARFAAHREVEIATHQRRMGRRTRRTPVAKWEGRNAAGLARGSLVQGLFLL